jgi:Na+-driven multidrug efflux pump
MPAANTEETREKGLSLEVIGGMVLFFDVLILFFLPAGLKLGHKSVFLAIMTAMAVLGIVLIAYGLVVRSRADRSA